jgi:NAD(P)-dependent dehydrogenase (short-subunit alcohol dehydrogenase family)
MSDLFDISKETILITGASQGLGRRFAAILLLASGASRYMTGSVVTVDGGFLLN